MQLSELIDQMIPPQDVEAVFRICCSQCGLPDGCDCSIEEVQKTSYELADIITAAKREAKAKRGH